MSTSYIFYKDVAPGADEVAQVTATQAHAYSTVADLALEKEDPPAIATLEPGRWLLDGAFTLPPATVPYWSDNLSNDACVLSLAPVITLEFPAQYSSVGVSLIFDRATGEYCRKVNIKWYQGGALKESKDFSPDGAFYFCQHTVTSWDKIIITLLETNLPYRRARLSEIVLGVHRRFGMDELRSVKLVNESDLAALTLPVSTLDWTLDSRADIQFMFQFKQPVEVWNGEKMIGVYYIDGFSRPSLHLRDINCYDAIGVLEEIPFDGGVYANKSAKSLLEEILGGDFDLEVEVPDTTLTGAILPGTKRAAMQQVLFAWGACVSTDGRYTLRVFHPPTAGTAIGPARTYVGASVETAAIVTAVRVTAHTYTLDANGSVEIGGQKYTDTTAVYSVTNPNVTKNDKDNVISVTNATLVSPAIGQAAAQRLYDWYARRDTAKGKVVWQGETLGGRVSLPTPWGEEVAGNITKMDITLSNTVAADMEVIG